MSATLSRSCPACGETHIFYLALGEKTDAQRNYRFTCPTTNTAATLQDDSNKWLVVPLRPSGTVFLTVVQP